MSKSKIYMQQLIQEHFPVIMGVIRSCLYTMLIIACLPCVIYIKYNIIFSFYSNFMKIFTHHVKHKIIIYKTFYINIQMKSISFLRRIYCFSLLPSQLRMFTFSVILMPHASRISRADDVKEYNKNISCISFKLKKKHILNILPGI